MTLRCVLLAMLVSGCNQTTATKPGALGPLTLERTGEPLPPDAVPANDWEAKVTLCGAPPLEPAKVHVAWRTVSRENERWVTGVRAELEVSSPSLVVEVNSPAKVGGASLQPDAPWVDVVSLEVKCRRRELRFPQLHEQDTVALVQLKATGEFSVDGQPYVAPQTTR